MRSILKKLHLASNQSEDDPDGSDLPSIKGFGKSPLRQHQQQPPPPQAEPKPLSSAISNWLNSVKHGVPPPPSVSSASSSPSSSVAGGERRELRDGPGTGSSVASEAVADAARRDSASSRPTEPEVPMDPEMDEEYQIQLALELSAREDPEAAQIEAVKQMSLGSCPPENTPAEVIAYRYWNYNSLNYDDKILDGFYDIYGILVESTSAIMPSLVDLQGTPVSDSISWEAVLVNKAEDADLSKLEQKALLMVQSDLESSDSAGSDLVRRLAILVADYMGGTVFDPDSMLKSYHKLRNSLRASVGNMVLPLGWLTVGLARHRALLFKVLADSLEISCRVVKGKQYTGSDDGALNIVKLSDGREYIVDLMAEPGTLIPSDGIGLAAELEDTFCVANSSISDVENMHLVSGDSGIPSSAGYSENELHDMGCISGKLETSGISEITMSDSSKQDRQISSSSAGMSSTEMYRNENVNILGDSVNISYDGNVKIQEAHDRPNQPSAIARSPSWTEGIDSPAVRRMKVRDVSQYMINAAKENPQLAQRLHDVLLESGVVAPPDLFAELGKEQSEAELSEEKNWYEGKDEMKRKKCGLRNVTQAEGGFGPFLPHLPTHDVQRKMVPSRPQLDPLKPVEGLGLLRTLDFQEAAGTSSSGSEASSAQMQENPLNLIKHMPYAAAAATAAVVASSMVVAAAKSNAEMNLEVPVAAAATATAAAVVATTAAVNRQYEHLDPCDPVLVESGSSDGIKSAKKIEDAMGNLQLGNEHGQPGGVVGNLQHGSDDGPVAGLEREQDTSEIHHERERTSDKSTGTESSKSDIAFDDVAEFEILWEDIILGERIGLGSFGEVYRGDWHGTEVAVKRFLQQDISSDALEEFRSEVRIMKRLRHPNVVLFMGAITRVPNLSIVTEFLPRGSLFRLIHRPNNQLDERRRLRMALDVARGMNYLHNCTPTIVHRDLKSPNLLVDKNWVVKVCDFGLSRIKHNTFLSSRSTAGTAEWMAPEVLRNEPSNEKCDVFSFGVILWELCTLQQPWDGMNAMQVVGAVGFQHRRLDIPDDVDPAIADMITKCWHTDPKLRPSFSEIMAALKPLQKPTSSSQVQRQRVQVAESSQKGRS